MNKLFTLLFTLIFFQNSFSQDIFQLKTDSKYVEIKFEMINNLIFIPVKLNDEDLTFLLDTGVDQTLLFGLEDVEKISLLNVKKLQLKGLGNDDSVEGLLSENNKLAINDLVNFDQKIYVILDEDFNISSHVGIPVNGILGYDFFKDNTIEINYSSNKIRVYKNLSFIKDKKLKKFSSIPIEIEKNKPYCYSQVQIDNNFIDSKVLIDSGNSDAMWLFRNLNDKIKLPKMNFDDYLGKGFSGDIYGKRTRINIMKLSNFEFEDPIIAMPDSTSIRNFSPVKDRVGSIGGGILKRFTVIFDYKTNQMLLKKNSSFNNPFDYNRIGIEIENIGKEWMPDTTTLKPVFDNNTFDIDGNKMGSQNYKYRFILKPIYTIAYVRANSPAQKNGLLLNDRVLSINGVRVSNFSLEKINNLLKIEPEKWVTIVVDRNGVEFKIKFQVKELL